MAVDVDARFYARYVAVLRLLRYLDVVVAVGAIAPVLALKAPLLGYSLGAGGWLAQRVIAEADRRWTRRVTEPVRQLGVTLFEGFARIWLLAGFIIVAAVVGGHRAGLTASLVIFAAYSMAFVTKLLTGPPRRRVAR